MAAAVREEAGVPASFELRFSPSDQLISIVRRFVLAFYGTILADNELSSQLALATHELLDNAVKYGSTPTAELAVTFVPEGDDHRIIVAIRNHAERHHIVEARRIIGELQAADSIFDHYQGLLHIAAEREDGSGLGLARIAAETKLALTTRVDGDLLEIRAEMQTSLKRPP